MVTRGEASRLSRHLVGKAFAIDGERAAGGKLVAVGRGENERACAAHLLMQEANGVARPIVGAERVGADELGKRIGLVRLGLPHRAHLMQHHRHAGDASCQAASLPARPPPMTCTSLTMTAS